MGVFDDTRRLFRQSFGWGLAPYNPVADDPDNDSEPEDVDSISVYVDEEGIVNVAKQLTLYESTDPIEGGVEHTYSKDNLFIAGLNKALTTVPVGGIILYPTYNPGSVAESRGRRNWFAAVLGPRYQGRTIYPRDTPTGFVPCVGQVLRYPDGSAFQVADLAPPVTSWGGWGGGRLLGGWGTNYFGSFLPAVRYMQRVPEGWLSPDPVLGRGGGKALGDITPRDYWEYGF